MFILTKSNQHLRRDLKAIAFNLEQSFGDLRKPAKMLFWQSPPANRFVLAAQQYYGRYSGNASINGTISRPVSIALSEGLLDLGIFLAK